MLASPSACLLVRCSALASCMPSPVPCLVGAFRARVVVGIAKVSDQQIDRKLFAGASCVPRCGNEVHILRWLQ